MRLAMSAMRLLLLLRRSLLSIQHLLWESISSILRSTRRSETLPFPEHYEAVDLPANWKEEVEAPAYQEAIETIHHHIRQGRYLPGQLHCPAFSRAKSRSFGHIQPLGG